MYNKIKKKLIFLLTLFFALSMMIVTTPTQKVSAENNVNYKQKVVSVVYDDSGSMSNEKYRPELARYSLQMLASMLTSQDELIVCPMNAWNTSKPSFTVDLAAADREKEIKEKIVTNSVLSPTGGTPSKSIEKAIDELEKRGLKLASELGNDEEIDKDYWLIMLTDGGFDNVSDPQKINDKIEGYIKGYTGLNTVYLSFGGAGVDLTNPSLSLNRDYLFKAYCVKESEKVTEAMEDIANKILGRYGVDSNTYTISGKSVTLDLSKFDFAMNSVTILAQKCGAQIESVKYNGKNITPTQKNKIVNCGLPFDEGYVAQIKDSGYMADGLLEITFDKNASNVTMLVEPAIYVAGFIEAKINGKWEEVDLQYINSNLCPGDEIRVKYKVYNSSDGKEINTEEIFGKPEEKITYGNKGYQVGEAIKLQKGRSEIAVQVSVLNGSYTMKSSLMCYVELNPTAYRLESKVNDNGSTVDIDYTIYSDDKALSDVSGYDFILKATDAKGNEVPFTKTISNGKIKITFKHSELGIGEYQVEAKVVNKESNLSRVKKDGFKLLPQNLSIQCLTTDAFETTPHKLKTETKKLEFALVLDGKKESFDNSIINYTVKVDGVDVTNKATIENGNLILVLSKDTVESSTVGEHKVEVVADAMQIAKGSASYKFTMVKPAVELHVVSNGRQEFDRYDIKSSKACISFKIYVDGQAYSVEEINEAMASGELSVETNPFGWTLLLPCDTVITVEEVNGDGQINVRVAPDVFSPLDNLLASFIFPNQKDIVLNYNGISATDTMYIKEVSFVSRLIRWVIILIILLIILHIVLYIVGFFTAKKLPTGVVVKYNGVSSRFPTTKVKPPVVKKLNLGKETLIWHLSRFIPFCELKNQKLKAVHEFHFVINKNTKRPMIIVEGGAKTCYIPCNEQIDTGSKAGSELSEMIDNYKKSKFKSPRIDMKCGEFISFFPESAVDANGIIAKGSIIPATETWYAMHDLKGDVVGSLRGYIAFIPVRKARKKRR